MISIRLATLSFPPWRRCCDTRSLTYIGICPGSVFLAPCHKAKEPLNNSFMVAPMPFRDGMQGAKRKAWSFHA